MKRIFVTMVDSLYYNCDGGSLGILSTQDVVLAETDLVTR